MMMMARHDAELGTMRNAGLFEFRRDRRQLSADDGLMNCARQFRGTIWPRKGGL